MSAELEHDAFMLAKEILDLAVEERWNYVSLSPRLYGVSELRNGHEVLQHLSVIPHKVRDLPSGVHIELRGTSIRDLKPLAHVTSIGWINFEDVPAVDGDHELNRISTIPNIEDKLADFRVWLEQNKVDDPPEEIANGPKFVVDDEGPIRLVDPNLEISDDNDQEDLRQECQRKSEELAKIVELAANVAPDLPATLERYNGLISRNPSAIGARSIWSVANSLQAHLETHEMAVHNNRQAEELPTSVAAKLKDLSETHRVWFLGHPGAREVEERATKHLKPADHLIRQSALIEILNAAEASEHVSPEATLPARENADVSQHDTPAGIAAYGEFEEWTWNFVASVTRKVWFIVKDPPGGFVAHTITAYYLVEFLLQNETAIFHYVRTVMSQGPVWWETLCNALRRLSLAAKADES